MDYERERHDYGREEAFGGREGYGGREGFGERERRGYGREGYGGRYGQEGWQGREGMYGGQYPGRYGRETEEGRGWQGREGEEGRGWQGREGYYGGQYPARYGREGREGVESRGIVHEWWVIGPHTGKGPRTYQRPDERIRDDVIDRLTQHGRIDASDIEVHVAQGVVTLQGTVDTRDEKRLAEDVVESVSGVKDVNNQIKVKQGLMGQIKETLTPGAQ